VLGALGFGGLTDRIGRKKLFFMTLALYLTADGGDGVVLEHGELRAVSISDRRRHWRRIHRDQFGDSGIGAGAIPRMDRPCDQWQLLDRRGDGRGQCDRSARSAFGLVLTSAGGWPIYTGACLGLVVVCDAMVDSGKSAWLMIHGQPDRAHAIVEDIERSAAGHVQDLRTWKGRSIK